MVFCVHSELKLNVTSESYIHHCRTLTHILLAFEESALLRLHRSAVSIFVDLPSNYIDSLKQLSISVGESDILDNYRLTRKVVLWKGKGSSNILKCNSYSMPVFEALVLRACKTESKRTVHVKLDAKKEFFKTLCKKTKKTQNGAKRKIGRPDTENDKRVVDLDQTRRLEIKVLNPRTSVGTSEVGIVEGENLQELQLEVFPSSEMPPKRHAKKKKTSRERQYQPPKEGAKSSSAVNGEDNLKYPVQETVQEDGAPSYTLSFAREHLGESATGGVQKTAFEHGLSHEGEQTKMGVAHSGGHAAGSLLQAMTEAAGTSSSESTSASSIPNISWRSTVKTEFPGQPKHAIYSDENTRRATYVHWPAHLKQSPATLATKGFFYTGTGDLARCYSCGLGLKGWDDDDDPLTEHVKHTRGCLFLTNLLGAERVAQLKAQFQGYIPNNGFTDLASSSAVQENYGLPFVPRHPNYISNAVRISSFARWPPGHEQTPELLADAGFFYTGVEDICRCFACDGGLRRWDPQDDPWIEHAKWFPHCPHILQKKGADFVERVRLMMESSSDDDPAVNMATVAQRMQNMNLHGRNGMSHQQLCQNKEKKDPLFTPAAQSVREMGYSRKAVRMALNELSSGGKQHPTSEEILEVLLDIEDRGEELPIDSPRSSPSPEETSEDSDTDDPEALLSENQRLKSMVICVLCNERERNVLTLPCTHHKMCQQCAEDQINCPDCGRQIKQKVKTYMS